MADEWRVRLADSGLSVCGHGPTIDDAIAAALDAAGIQTRPLDGADVRLLAEAMRYLVEHTHIRIPAFGGHIDADTAEYDPCAVAVGLFGEPNLMFVCGGYGRPHYVLNWPKTRQAAIVAEILGEADRG